jgi:MoaA/NifB/PqqE/SkfB family radical SAM enzyme
MLKGITKLFKRDHREYEVFQIEISSYSSLECKICPQAVFAEKWLFQNMALDTYQRIAQNFNRTKWVTFQGWGDPLENEYFLAMLRQAHQAGCLTGLVTNGFHLSESLSQQIVEEELEFIVIHLEEIPPVNQDGPRRDPELTHILNQVEGLIRIKKTLKRPKPVVRLSFFMTRLNIQTLSQAILMAADVGVDEILLRNLDYLPEDRWNILRTFYHESPTASFQESLDEIQRLAKEMKISVRFYPLKAEEIPVCEAEPHRSVFFSVDGSVGPCMFLRLPKKGKIPRIFLNKEYTVEPKTFGNITAEDRPSVWGKGDYQSFRKVFEDRVKAQRNVASIFDAVSNRSSTPQEIIEPPPLSEPCRTCYKAYGI